MCVGGGGRRTDAVCSFSGATQVIEPLVLMLKTPFRDELGNPPKDEHGFLTGGAAEMVKRDEATNKLPVLLENFNAITDTENYNDQIVMVCAWAPVAMPCGVEDSGPDPIPIMPQCHAAESTLMHAHPHICGAVFLDRSTFSGYWAYSSRAMPARTRDTCAATCPLEAFWDQHES